MKWNEMQLKHVIETKITFNCWLVLFKNWISSACFFSSIARRSASRFSMASHLAFNSFTCFSSSNLSSPKSTIYTHRNICSVFVISNVYHDIHPKVCVGVLNRFNIIQRYSVQDKDEKTKRIGVKTKTEQNVNYF